MKVVLTIAGTDPSGAAGIQADLQTIRDHGCHGVSVITSVLAQNTQGVRSVLPMPPDTVAAQLDAVFDDFDVAAVKVGLVPDDAVLDVLSDRLVGHTVVWDPVLASGDGDTALFAGTTRRLMEVLTDVTIVTPNLPEIAALSGGPVETRDEARRTAAAMSALGPAVLLKVGHLDHADILRDVWAVDGEAHDLEPLPAISADVRGTGCQLSAALACNLAAGLPLRTAAEAARSYLNDLLNTRALKLGRGRLLVIRN